jgi:ParB family chromosome partitioning protein
MLVKQIPLALVRRNNIRTKRDAQKLANLKQSIATLGQLYPILVFALHGLFEVIDGHGRVEACEELGMETIAALVQEGPTSEDHHLHKALVSNVQREGLSPVDMAKATSRLMELNSWNASQVAQQLGLSVSAITKSLSILKLPAEIVEQIESRKILASAAYELSRITDPQKQAELAKRLACGQLTRDGLAQKRQRATSSRQATKASGKRAVVYLTPGSTLTLSGKSLDFENFITACEIAAAQAKKARQQKLSFATFLLATRDQAVAAP